ncbi:glycosyltransferase [Methylomonas koyamae]|uniref:glycosyltransferase n=1 Tax=Methylomonas koyamae TaxID=702114 RepID=UPI0006D1CD0F|nr:glycosyltransferase [Methylomonas koyamae]BBL56566.1 glycosyl transferase family 1 [Methylomonas koyamae]
MKILHVISSVNPESGGPIEAVRQLSDAMVRQGHGVEIVSLDLPSASYLADFPFTVYPLGPKLGIYGYCKNLKPWLKANVSDYDAVIIHGLWQYHSFAAHSVLNQLRKPYYLFSHGMLDPWFKRQYPLKHLKKYLYWLWGEYPVIRDAKKVLFTCEEEKVLARQSFRPYKANEQVVNFGTAGHTGDLAEQRALFLNRFPRLENKKFLLYLSRIHPKKGLDMLIESYASSHRENPAFELVIAGPDQIGWQKSLEQQAVELGVADNITWTGMLSGDLKWGAYAAADAFILPSHQENFGIVVAESLSCGLPVLISNKVNIWYEIDQDGAGLVADDTLSGCNQLLAGWSSMAESDKAALRANARRCFMERFEINKAANSLLDVLSG